MNTNKATKKHIEHSRILKGLGTVKQVNPHDPTPQTATIITTAITKIVETLTVLEKHGVEFLVRMPDGQSYGNIVLTPPPAPEEHAADETLHKKKPYTRNGDKTGYVKPFLENLQVGDVAIIPEVGYGAAAVQGYATAYCYKVWGAGSYMSSINHKTHAVEIMRMK